MPVSGLILEVAPGMEREISFRVGLVPQVEVRALGSEKLVVVTDTADLESDRRLTENLRSLPGVREVSVVFTNMEDCLRESG